MIALGGPPPDDLRIPTDMGIVEVFTAPRWPWQAQRRIGWVLWELHGRKVEQRAMIYARTGEQR